MQTLHVRPLALALAALLVAACSSTGDQATGPRQEPPSRSGNPLSYDVFGKRYFILGTSEGYRERGVASWYGDDFHGKRTSSGTPFDMHGISAAHKTLPIPTWVKVTHLANGKSLVLRVNDRGPFVGDRILDLSFAAAKELGMTGKGTGEVLVEAIAPYQTLADAASRPRPSGAPGTLLAALTPPTPRSEPTAPVPRAVTAATPAAQPWIPSQTVAAAPALPTEPADAGATITAPAITAPAIAAAPIATLPLPAPTRLPAAGPTLAAAAPPLRPAAAPVSVPVSARPAHAAPAANGGVFLQLGAFADRRNAETLRQRARPEFPQGVYLDEARGDGLVRVKLGPFLTSSEAERAVARADSLGFGRPRMVVY